MKQVAHSLVQAEFDSELIARVARGELEALGQLYDRHEPGVRRYLGRLGLARGDVDDLVQSVFLEVVRSAARFDVQASARNWMYGIATMLVRRHRRSLRRYAARLLSLAHVDRDDVRSPEECYCSDQAAARFEAAFRGLSAKKREVFVLVLLEGLSGEETAQTLGIPVNTVWTRLHHARAELRGAVIGGQE